MKEFYNGVKMICALDLESSDLLEDSISFSSGFPLKLKDTAKLWCISIYDLQSKLTIHKIHTDTEDTKKWLKETLFKYDTIVTHNGIKFDLPILSLFGVIDYQIGYLDSDTLFGRQVEFIDTLILSRLLSPSRLNGHSLESWGDRLEVPKIDYRQRLIDLGVLDKSSDKTAAFKFFHPEMVIYCDRDTELTGELFKHLWNLIIPSEYQAIKSEHKLADLSINRELFGFDFDKNLAEFCVQDLDNKLQELRDRVNPILPPKKLTKSEIGFYTLPVSRLKKNGDISIHMQTAIKNHNLFVYSKISDKKVYFLFKDKEYPIDYNLPLETHRPGDIADTDHVKEYLINLGWIPSEWKVRDLTKTADKKDLPYEKRVVALKRYMKETYEGKYKNLRAKQLGIMDPEDRYEFNVVYTELKNKLNDKFPVRVPTSPSTRVGVSKDICPNLISLGSKVAFAEDFIAYSTYKHRRSSIADKEYFIDDVDDKVPEKGFLAALREDGRISTPAIEIGAASTRYRHITVANIPRATSIYGKEMRSLFGAGEDYYQIGFDFSSLENRVQGGYVRDYPDGENLACALLAEKPNDLHSINATKLGISRNDAKSFGYAILYGAFISKLAVMLNKSFDETKELYDNYWDSVPALKSLKEDLTTEWINTNKKYIIGIDGRRIYTRSEHSLLNYLFQSGGVVAAKYVTLFIFKELEDKGYCISPFRGKPDICSMIEYHDENQIAVLKSKNIIKIKSFKTEEEAKEYISNYKDKYQLSNVKPFSNPDKGFYISLPNDVSKAIYHATKHVEKLLKLKFELGFEWDLGKNWYQCH